MHNLPEGIIPLLDKSHKDPAEHTNPNSHRVLPHSLCVGISRTFSRFLYGQEDNRTRTFLAEMLADTLDDDELRRFDPSTKYRVSDPKSGLDHHSPNLCLASQGTALQVDKACDLIRFNGTVSCWNRTCSSPDDFCLGCPAYQHDQESPSSLSTEPTIRSLCYLQGRIQGVHESPPQGV